ncbi:MAG: ArsI/CadI family heavy metal resistance metalloenzyme [Verrucomicrobiota bacterium]
MNTFPAIASAKPAAPPAPRRFHVSLNVSDLERSVKFYRVLTGMEPAKHHADYAKFELEDPPLVLSLEPRRSRSGGQLNHLGIRMSDSAVLVEIQKRLEDSGFRTRRQKGVQCCYARQTKFWVSDPDGALWELYTLHEDTEDRGDGHVPLDMQLTSGNAAFAVSRLKTYLGHKFSALRGGDKACCPSRPDAAALPHSDSRDS